MAATHEFGRRGERCRERAEQGSVVIVVVTHSLFDFGIFIHNEGNRVFHFGNTTRVTRTTTKYMANVHLIFLVAQKAGFADKTTLLLSNRRCNPTVASAPSK